MVSNAPLCGNEAAGRAPRGRGSGQGGSRAGGRTRAKLRGEGGGHSVDLARSGGESCSTTTF